MPGTVMGRTGSLFLLGVGIVWLLIWLILAYSSKQKSTLAVLAVFSLIWAGLGFWRAMAGDPSRHAESREPVSARSAAKVWKASVSARTWVKCDTALGN